MSGNVVLISDNAALSGVPDEGVIEDLEALLVEARSGTLRAFAYARVSDDSFGTGWSGADGTRDSLGMAILALSVRFPVSVMEEG